MLYQEAQIQTACWYIVSDSFNSFWIFKDCYNKHDYNLIISAKTAALGLLKKGILK